MITLKLSAPHYRALTSERAQRALKSGKWANGVRAKNLEARIAALADVDPANVVATKSCTAALEAAGRIMGFEKLRAPPLTWPGTYAWHPNVEFAEEGLDINVDLWGIECTWAPIIDAAHRFAPEHAARRFEKGFAEAICYSFGPQKEICCWSGGAVITAKKDLADEIRKFLNYGTEGRVWSGGAGRNGLMTDVEAAWIAPQMRSDVLRDARDTRMRLLEVYERFFGDALLTPPVEASGHLAVVRAESPFIRDAWRRRLERARIQWGHHYPLNALQRQTFPGLATLSDEIITLPLHLGLKEREVKRVLARLV